jgi:hypothetical protein
LKLDCAQNISAGRFHSAIDRWLDATMQSAELRKEPDRVAHPHLPLIAGSIPVRRLVRKSRPVAQGRLEIGCRIKSCPTWLPSEPLSAKLPKIMRLFLIFLATVAIAGAEEDTWSKVCHLKSGTELRILRKSSRQPVLATMDEATDSRLIVVLKNAQIAIPKDDIDRIDSRQASGRRFTKNSRVTTKATDIAPTPTVPSRAALPSTSSSNSLTINTKPDFETVYRRKSKSSLVGANRN